MSDAKTRESDDTASEGIGAEALIAAAVHVRDLAYAPYSRFSVGAAVLDRQGRMFSGCNIENASFGLTICAERVAFGNAIAHGARDFVAVAVVARRADGEPVAPCGACRQVMAELAPKATVLLETPDGTRREVTTVEDLLPGKFSADDLPKAGAGEEAAS